MQEDLALIRAPGALFDGYIFDLDGTVYLGDALLPGARRLLARLRALGRRTVFLSNNPTKDPEEYAAKLTALGVPAAPADIINTVVTMTGWLVRHYPEAAVFPIAEAPLQRALRAAGIRLSENPAEIDFVIASYDRTFDYRKLQIAFDALWYHKRARLIATNPDRYCPFPGGRGEPDAAAIIAALEACAGVTCELVTGKPSPLMLDAALRVLDLPAASCVMVGDRLATDIRMARAAEMPSALVLTGDTTVADLRAAPPSDRPDYVLTRIDQLLPPGSA
ncbi:MAG TPA: HAD-IIA family hydrolase [Thermomicrobiales bacterium]|nr:HAD-IIA family hydrolase [Thermomicrobiales bacterium]